VALITFKKNETDIGSLVKRLYPGLDDSVRKKIVAAVLKENPHLKEVNAVRPGVVVKLPEIPEVTVKPAASGVEPVEEVQNQLTDAVKEYQKILKERMAEAGQEIDLQLEMLHDEVIRKAIAASGQAAENLAKQLEESLAERLAMLSEEQKVQKDILNTVVADLQAMSDW